MNIPLQDPEIRQTLDNVLCADDDKPARNRQVIGASPKDEGSVARPSSEDEELPNDLKNVIRDKFSDV